MLILESKKQHFEIILHPLAAGNFLLSAFGGTSGIDYVGADGRICRMAAKKSWKTASETDPIAPVRLDEDLQPLIRRASKRLRMNPTRLVNRAVSELLEREGYALPNTEREPGKEAE